MRRTGAVVDVVAIDDATVGASSSALVGWNAAASDGAELGVALRGAELDIGPDDLCGRALASTLRVSWVSLDVASEGVGARAAELLRARLGLFLVLCSGRGGTVASVDLVGGEEGGQCWLFIRSA